MTCTGHPNMSERSKIDELEKLLRSDSGPPVVIRPDGTIEGTVDPKDEQIADLLAALKRIRDGKEVRIGDHTEIVEVEDASEIARAAIKKAEA